MNQNPTNPSPIDSQLAAPPAVDETVQTPTITPASSASTTDLLQSRGAVLAILFLVTGVLGIPLLWMNRNFSTGQRIFWAIIVSLYTTLLILGAGAIVWWAYSRIFP